MHSTYDRGQTHSQAATAVGEITTLTDGQLTITGDYNAGLAITLHPGTRVYVFTDGDLDEHVGHFDGVLEDLEAAEARTTRVEKQLKDEKKTTARLQRLLTAETARVAELTGPTA